MRRLNLWVLLLCVGLVGASGLSGQTQSSRVVFGERADQAGDFSGRVTVTPKRVLRLEGWRFFGEDRITGADSWLLSIKRVRFENQPDAPRQIMNGPFVTNVVPAGIDVTVEAPADARVEVTLSQRKLSFSLRELAGGGRIWLEEGNIWVQQVPTVEQVTPPQESATPEQRDYPSVLTARDGSVWVAWQGYRDQGDHLYVRRFRQGNWEDPERLTEEKGDLFRTALGEDAQGRVWVVWSERHGQQWDLYARYWDRGQWSRQQKISSASHPNAFHRIARSPSGTLHLVWIGYENGQSRVYWSRLEGMRWSSPQAISGPSAWHPEAAVDPGGNLWVTWDSYRHGNYDVFLRRIDAEGTLGPEIQVTKSPLFQAHPTIAVDGLGRVWLAWDESDANWGKDWTRDDQDRGTVLYKNRRAKVAVYANGRWMQPVAEVRHAIPARYWRYVQLPRLAIDGRGTVWLGLQLRTSTVHNRSDFWAYDGRWEFYLTWLKGSHWSEAVPIPHSSLRPEGPWQLEPQPSGVRLVWACDNRPLFAQAFYLPIPNRHEIFTARWGAAGWRGEEPVLEPFAEDRGEFWPVHPDEPKAVERMRSFRVELGGKVLGILRGDFHRHTEISSDGAGDGSLEDYFRYMLDAAAMDTGIVGDHNAGNDDEYSWWRTEKANDLFLIPGRYTPMFGYERSPNYSNGHRNVVFAQRGVRTLPIPEAEMRGEQRSGPILFPYLRRYRGIAMPHSLATSQGTDWGDHDPEVEPLVELYQGYHASYEYAGAPRAESDRFTVRVHGDYKPAGFWWEALKRGLKLGVQASSDHISTHASYTMIYSPSRRREDILESMRRRHVYAATDNIVVDFRAIGPDGRVYLMGEELETGRPPELMVRVIGTDIVRRIDLIRDEQFIYHLEPEQPEASFRFRDTDPKEGGESYYYVRIEQLDRNLAWSSPIWVRYRR